MSRVKRGTIKKKKRRKYLSQARGYVAGRSKLYTVARAAVERGLAYAYRDRRTKKREIRALWIERINAASRANGLTYSQFMNGLSKAKVDINRKVLADMAVNDPTSFSSLVEVAKKHIEATPAKGS